ncbi:alkaline phosphatase family protein [Pseudodesulfovibrio sp.]|uniref:alkaline phosphatase family protein n=1 Tax=Pseudodesulfovibrio sp. TaxID=2035812 RepID=UPI00262A5D5E|nr:alkaline phosphatase family protein [Pseudodesulfovibrio sp.]MDD3310872.1 alkaline phosphatase family protein [Pseudodesulfovibrio sp.]
MSLLLSAAAPRRRLAVLGLDGLPLALARRLGATLPNIGRLAQGATTVRAELPELSPVNWTSFYTGEGPEAHGVLGFSRMDPATYRLDVACAADVRRPTVFDRLGAAGLVSRVVNLPNTYPARPLRGMLVAGFVAPELTRAVYPPFLADLLAKSGYRLEADTTRRNGDLDYLLGELRRTLDSRLTALSLLWDDLAWDLFVHVFTETDRLFHFAMDAVLDPGHPRHDACLAFLKDWDAAIGVFLAKYDALPGEKRLLVMADHGFTRLATEVCVNTWLRQHGYLSLTGTPADEWDASVIAGPSRAFALDPGRIYLHRQGRFARGTVQPEEVEPILEEIRNGLLGLTWNGERVMEQVLRGEECYPGMEGGLRPDLVCVGRPGFDLKAKFDRDAVFGLHGRTGAHTVEGAIFADSQGARPERMRDVGRIVLDHFNLSGN